MSGSVASEVNNGQPLPVNPYRQGDDIHEAYERCRQLELCIAWNAFVGDPVEDILESMPPILAARLLGHGLRHAPSTTGRDALSRDILACTEQPELAVLAYLYVFRLICVFYTPRSSTRADSPAFTPRMSLEAAARSPHLEPSSSNAATLRALTLLRDNHRCVFTGRLDYDCWDVAANVDLSTKTDVTYVAHIISVSLTNSIHGTEHQDRFQWANTAGAMIERFGSFSPHDVLGPDNLHSPKNAFIASVAAHTMFGRLDIWLTPATNAQQEVIRDTYKISHPEGREALLRGIGIDVDRPVVFRDLSFDGQIIPAPDPRIIELHAACAKIAHESGAAEHLCELYRDTDSSIAVMTHPNAADELSRALKILQLASATTV